jgi:hypothetical protein
MASPFLSLPLDYVLFSLGAPNLPINTAYKAIINSPEQLSVLGTVIKLDARNSIGALGEPPKYYYWSFTCVPIGSQVEKFGFQDVENDGSSVKFSPDLPGIYKVSLVVGDEAYNSETTYGLITVKIMLVPFSEGIVPDASFIWRYLGDFWTQFKDTKVIDTTWSSYIQIAADTLLDVYQTEFNRTPINIQELYQKRWLDYNPNIELDKEFCTVTYGEDIYSTAGISGYPTVTNTDNFVDGIYTATVNGKFSETPYKKIGSRLLKFREQGYLKLNALEKFVGLVNYSIFFTKPKTVINESAIFPWRYLPTIKCNLNVEELGASPGDVIEFKLCFKGNRYQESFFGANDHLQTIVRLPIRAVQESYIGFSLNFNKEVDGQSLGTLPDDVIYKIAQDLKIPGVRKDIFGVITIESNTLANFIKTSLNSLAFKKLYFEEELTFSEISLGTFEGQAIKMLIEPVRLIRNNRILLDELIDSIPSLQEFIQTPTVSEKDGKIYVTTRDSIQEFDHYPYYFYENLDYTISKQDIPVEITVGAGNKNVLIPFGDLIDRRVQIGDMLEVTGGSNVGQKFIITVVNDDNIKVNKAPSFSETTHAIIHRKVPGNFLRFTADKFKVANLRLWADVTFLDNNPNIEANFGKFVNLTIEQYNKQNITASYKAAVSGLLYGIARGASVSNLKTGAQIILGLPFNFYRGVITSIDPSYNLNSDFSPKNGQIIIEELDDKGNKTGTSRIYFYPQGKQILDGSGKWIAQDPEFSGLAINPKTDMEYKVGDIIEQFSPLSKGVELYDYYSNPEFVDRLAADPKELLKKYHTFYFRVNAGIISTPDLTFLRSYLLNSKPSYTRVKIVSSIKFADNITIIDKIKLNIGLRLFENSGLSLPIPLVSNLDNWYSKNFITVDNEIYTRYLVGDDLQTTYNSTTVTSSAGGFVTQRQTPPYYEVHDSPFLYNPTDKLFIYSQGNQGIYDLASVVNDTTLTTTFSAFATQKNKFAIYKKISNPLFRGTTSLTTAGSTFTTNPGLLSAGVSSGDRILFWETATGNLTRQYIIDTLTSSTITLTSSFKEISSDYSFVIWREKLLPKSLFHPEIANPFVATLVSGTPWITLSATEDEDFIVKKGDSLYVEGDSVYEILDFNFATKQVFVTPTPSINLGAPAKIWRNQYYTGIPVDVDYQGITEEILFTMIPDTGKVATVINGSREVVFTGIDIIQLNILPGDFFKINTGPDASLDVGYGVGMFVVSEIVSSTKLKVTRPFNSTQNSALFKLCRLVA